jgi:hypothetical protein
LINNTTLTTLDLSKNKIGDYEIITESFIKNTTLTKLNLALNKIGVIGAKGIAKPLKKNTT